MLLKRYTANRLLAGLLIAISSQTFAANTDFAITVTTQADVQLNEVDALDFGANMFVEAGGVCTLAASTPGSSLVDLPMAVGADIAQGAGYGKLSGTGCITGADATPGLYQVTAGAPGQTVNITISEVAGTSFSFYPSSGCIVNYDGSANGDTCASFIPNTLTTVQLANAADATTATAGNAPAEGTLAFTVGGTITIGSTDLTPNTHYSEKFNINVVY